MTKSTSAAPYASGTGSNFWTSLTKALPGEAEPPVDSPQAIMMSPALKAFHPVDALLVNRGTVKSRRKAWDVDNFRFLLLRSCGA